MSDFVTGTFTWMIIECLLTAAMFGLYFLLQQFKLAAADRYLFLKTAFASVLFLPWIPFSWRNLFSEPSLNMPAPTATSAVVRISEAIAPEIPRLPWLPSALVGIYLVILLLAALKMTRSMLGLRRLKRQSTFAFSWENIPIYACHEDLPPATFGFRKPIILLSQQILDTASKEEIIMILQHEMVHIRRHDYLFHIWKNIVQYRRSNTLSLQQEA